MPKKARELSAVEVKRLTEPGLYAVGGVAGLHLQVAKTGARSWVLRATVGAKRRDIGLGGYPDTPLASAREKAREAREKIQQGIDPVAERRALRSALLAQQVRDITFEQCAAEVIKKKQAESRNAKHAQQWENTLKTYAYPVLGKMAVADVDLAHVLKVLQPDWETKTETMTRVRQRIEAVIAWATVHGHRSGDNPARWKGNLDAILPKPSKVTKVKHHKALPIDDMGEFVANLRQQKGVAALALEFTILTATRSGEVRGATWAEIDLDNAIWTIPAGRMKTEKEHRVPLSKEALKLLKRLPHDSELVFPAPKGGKFSDAALAAVLKRMGVDATVHGFRSTFRDWSAERTSYPHHVCEMALAHTIKNAAEAAYRRGDLMEKRTKLMQDWAKFCGTIQPKGEVVPLRKAEM
ncbi:integrase arm-type DNA-binding domain-containing protein [Halomonas sp. LR3S48]|uniref:tyrosine-type recombinase/integrase n=1 Tax=Halomonas sp. LR3S48 TaxID=2982694 RepID=UPI0021E446B3|nr:site-specific integrase [Halomonas sp. LR3S48]UYG01758.1 integrase arm-type DNA-binding domain-containing protein [Halomonas sp. LR3S48]